MFSVVRLVLSKQPDTQQKIRSMTSGFSWEVRVLDRLPTVHFWQIPQQSAVGRAVVAGLAGIFSVYIYFYWSRGFDVTRRIRIIGDALVALVKRETEPLPSVGEASARLIAAGWSEGSIRSGLWFLALLNVRILYKNDVYQQLTPRGYGLYRLTGELVAVSALSAVHPVIAGLFVASELKKTKDLKSTTELYRKHFANLPESFRSGLRLVEAQR